MPKAMLEPATAGVEHSLVINDFGGWHVAKAAGKEMHCQANIGHIG